MMRLLKILVSTVLTLSLHALEHGASDPSDPAEQFFTYQWALKASGQSESKDITDIRSELIKANPLATLQWNKELQNLMKRDVVVAVIDSGLDVDHPDIKNQLYKNEVECVGGQTPLDPKEDKDGNGYIGDCLGWNYAVSKSNRRATPQMVIDDIGHGTHVAGIIGAQVNNGIGISGLSNRIKILPLKVYDNKEATEVPLGRREPIPARVAKAIDYAVSRGASVINMSLGWPYRINSAAVESSLKNAIAKGVFIVAGAGNDYHNAPIYPCSAEGVICVGSVDMDGNASDFSNFGAQVDIFAPGKSILSLYPMSEFSFFGPVGYQIMSGTSQASPYVAGSIALLIGAFPDESPAQIKQRLLNQSFANLPKLINDKITYKLFPSFKGNRLFNVNPGEKLTLPLTLENLDPRNANATLTLKSDNQLFNVTQKVNLKPGLNQINFTSNREIQSEDPSTVLLKLTIDSRSFEHTIYLAQNPEKVKDRIEFHLPINLQLSSVTQYPNLPNQDPAFFTARVSKDDDKSNLLVSIFEIANGTLKTRQVLIKDSVSLHRSLPLLKADMNFDGKMDYAIFSYETAPTLGAAPDDSQQVVTLVSLLDHNLQPLFQGSDRLTLKAPHIPLLIPSLRLVKSTSAFGTFNLPAFWTFNGFIPDEDKNPNPLDFENTRAAPQIYVLEPLAEQHTRLKLLTDYRWRQAIEDISNAVYPEQLALHLPMVQNNADLISGKLQAVVSVGLGTQRKFYLAEVLAQWSPDLNLPLQLKPMDLGGRSLRFTSLDSVLDTASKNGSAASLTEVFSSTGFRTLIFNNVDRLSITDEMSVQLDDEANPILNILQVASVNGVTNIAIERANNISIASQTTNNGDITISEAPIYRTSYLPGATFSQSYSPVIVAKDGRDHLGFFVDYSFVFMPSMHAWIPASEFGKTYAPIKYSYQLPADCFSKNPVRINGTQALVMQCGPKLKMFPLK
jgi:hypothetical protein